jgi:hypothetical protein
MMRLKALFTDQDPKGIDRNDFKLKANEGKDPIYTITYLNGSIEKGELSGTWNLPPRSPTNSALLWCDTIRFFLGNFSPVCNELYG